MSTRRARIKAIASLPVRRKNTETKDYTRSKQISPKESVNDEKKIDAAPKNDEVSDNLVISESNTFKDKPNVTTINPMPADEIIITTPISTNEFDKNKSTPTAQVIVETKGNKSLNRYESESDTENANCTQISSKYDKSKNVNPVIIDGISKISPSLSNMIDGNIVDGIVPLQIPPKPKPLNLLKHEIISENAEVLFDPIVPLPSPSKVRPKLRPVPRLGPLRRNSIQV